MRYFEDVQQTCETHGITDEAQIVKWMIYYVVQSEEDVFKGVSDEAKTTVESFKKAIIAEYPGSGDDSKYDWTDLEAVVAEYTKKTEWTKEDVGAYYRSFHIRATYLIKSQRCGTRDANLLFLRAFPKHLYDNMKLHLVKSADDKDRPENGWDYVKVRDAALKWVSVPTEVAGPAAEGSVATVTTGSVPRGGTPAPATAVKTEAPDRSTILQVIEELRTQGVLGSRTAAPPAAAPAQRTFTPRGHCNFCGAPGHYQRECPEVQTYVNGNKLMRDPASGMLALPSGARFPSYSPGSTLKEKIDNYYGDNAGRSGRDAPPHMTNFVGGAGSRFVRDAPPHLPSVNILEAEEAPGPVLQWFSPDQVWTQSFQWFDPDAIAESGVCAIEVQALEAAEDSTLREDVQDELTSMHTAITGLVEQMHALQAAVLDKKSVRFEGPARVGPPQRGAKKAAEKPKATVPEVAPTPSAMKKTAGDQAENNYRLQSAIEDPEAETSVMEAFLDTPVNLKIRHLFTLSPTLRKSLKELCTTKRVPVAANFHEVADLVQEAFADAETVLHTAALAAGTEEDDEDSDADDEDGPAKVVAPDTLPLRCLRLSIAGKSSAECILDPGSQIVVMRRDVWQRTGAPLRTDLATKMVSANNLVNWTMGMVRDLEFKVADIALHLQVHVVDDAPFEVLLGRPFFVLGTCNTKDFERGDQHLTLTDPNTGRTITVPTQPRVQRKTHKKKEGFC